MILETRIVGSVHPYTLGHQFYSVGIKVLPKETVSQPLIANWA